MGRGSEAAEGGRAAGAGLRDSAQECVNQPIPCQKNSARTCRVQGAAVLKAETLEVLADAGYSVPNLRRGRTTASLPMCRRRKRTGGARSKAALTSRTSATTARPMPNRCPAGELLHPMKGRWQNISGRQDIRYTSRRTTCRACKLRAGCLSPKASEPTIRRWEHEMSSIVIGLGMKGCDARTNCCAVVPALSTTPSARSNAAPGTAISSFGALTKSAAKGTRP